MAEEYPDFGMGTTPHRQADADNLKTVLVAAVIVGHATMAWTGLGNWVVEEPHIREPWLSLASLLVLGALFGMAIFFFVAGAFTVPSFRRKGPRRFLLDRTLRLGLPTVFFVIFLSPLVEYVDTDNAGWDRGFWAFVRHILWPPAPGPTWFLWVLLVFSAGYAGFRTLRPEPHPKAAPLEVRHLVVVAAIVTTATFLIRFSVPLGDEVWHLSLSQAPGWLAGFALGVVGAEQGWYTSVPAHVLRVARRAALAAVVAAIALLALAGDNLDPLGGGANWQALVAATAEGVLVASMPLLLTDLFRRRFAHQGRIGRAMGRAGFAAFVIHQAVLIGLVLASRQTPWAPEIEFLLVSGLAVAASFGVGSLVLRVPGVGRIV